MIRGVQLHERDICLGGYVLFDDVATFSHATGGYVLEMGVNARKFTFLDEYEAAWRDLRSGIPFDEVLSRNYAPT